MCIRTVVLPSESLRYLTAVKLHHYVTRFLPAGSRSAGACELWWLYWKFWTAASRTVWCTDSQLLKIETRSWVRFAATRAEPPRDQGARLCSGGGHVLPAIDYLAHLWRPTPWGPRRRHWLGNGAWGGSVPRTTPPCHAAPAAAPTGCCWTVPAQSRAPPAQTPAATLRKRKAGEKCALKENKKCVWTVNVQWINYLSCSITCPVAFWTHTHRGDRWMFYNRGWPQDWTEEKKRRAHISIIVPYILIIPICKILILYRPPSHLLMLRPDFSKRNRKQSFSPENQHSKCNNGVKYSLVQESQCARFSFVRLEYITNCDTKRVTTNVPCRGAVGADQLHILQPPGREETLRNWSWPWRSSSQDRVRCCLEGRHLEWRRDTEHHPNLVKK